jgi:hypothetical protein
VRTKANVMGQTFFEGRCGATVRRRKSPPRPAAHHVWVPSRWGRCRGGTGEDITVQRELDRSLSGVPTKRWLRTPSLFRTINDRNARAPDRILAWLFCLDAPTPPWLFCFVPRNALRKSHDVRQSPTSIGCVSHFLPHLALGCSQTCVEILFVTHYFGFSRERDS